MIYRVLLEQDVTNSDDCMVAFHQEIAQALGWCVDDVLELEIKDGAAVLTKSLYKTITEVD